MDIVRLVESGKYTTEGFDNLQMECINTFDIAIDEVESCAANRFDVAEDAPLLDRMVAEIQNDAAQQIKEWLYATKCEHIVSFGDDNASRETA